MNLINWLLESDEPWTRYRTLVDLLDRSEDDPEVQTAHAELVLHSQVQALIARAGEWGKHPLKRHNDASHSLYALSTLADFGLRASDPGLPGIIDQVLAHSSPEGAIQSLVNISPTFGGAGADQWAWMACDAPTLLYALLALGQSGDARVQQAAAHLAGLAAENGYHCAAARALGQFKGPGRRGDPCPIANVYALKALAWLPEYRAGQAAQRAAAMLLEHWEHRERTKYYLFGVGSDFRKLKYPFVWYDLLHVADVLSRFPFVHPDPRFQEMLAAIREQADPQGRYTASSMFLSWKGWSFADKKTPSPWLTFLALRIQKRCG